MISLTIGIPTYNRSSKLEKLLVVINHQISKINNPKIELIISNNNSEDNTKEVIEKFNFSDKIKVKIINQYSNIGFDANVNSILKKSSGIYTWTLSDDDELKDEAIHEIYKITQSNYNYKFIFINYLISNGKKINFSNYESNSSQEVNSIDLLKIIDYSNSFISSCIFNTYEWSKIDVEPYLNSYWVHLFMSREVLNEGKSYIIGKPLLLQKEREDYPKIYKGEDIPGHVMVHYNLCFFIQSLSKYEQASSQYYLSSLSLFKKDLKQIVYYKLTRDKYRFYELIKITNIFYHVRKFHVLNLINLLILFSPKTLFILIKKIKNLFFLK